MSATSDAVVGRSEPEEAAKVVKPPRSPAPEPSSEGAFRLEEDLVLNCGVRLERPTLQYSIYGRLREGRDNVVLACHALSGSSRVGTWWPELFSVAGRPGLVNLERDCLICVNLLGSCYGSTGPGSVNPRTGQVYGPDFPLISVLDNVRAQARLMDWLGVKRIRLAVGGSIGGMQVLDWAIHYPQRIEQAVVIAVAPLNAMGLALNHLQRQAITGDPEWRGGRYPADRPPARGLSLARQTAMLSYKSADLFEERFGRKPDRSGEDPWSAALPEAGLVGGRFDVAGFLDYQGSSFPDRFDANSYLSILRLMDTWDPARGFATAAEAYSRIEARVLVVGISSDWLFPPGDVRGLAESLRAAGADAEYREMKTGHGHDAFLAEQAELVRLLDRPGA